MSFSTPIQLAIDSLVRPGGLQSLSREKAMKYLRDASNTDYGGDIVAWIRWAKRENLIDSSYSEELDEDREAA